jgi:rhodanese-related sulfurtransferase
MRILLTAVLAVLLSASMAYSHTDVTPAYVRAWMDTASSGVLVDVREESEFCDSTYNPPNHIPGAINMPWNSGYFQANYTDLPADEEIIIVCRSGNRSNLAANFLYGQEGYDQVFDMLGGMNEWTYETESCAAAGVPGPGDRDEDGAAAGFRLGLAVPNPFTYSTEISFALPDTESHGDLSLRVYDARGRRVATLVDDAVLPAGGRVMWDGTDDRGQAAASGLYFFRLTHDGESQIRRVVLLR